MLHSGSLSSKPFDDEVGKVSGAIGEPNRSHNDLFESTTSTEKNTYLFDFARVLIYCCCACTYFFSVGLGRFPKLAVVNHFFR